MHLYTTLLRQFSLSVFFNGYGRTKEEVEKQIQEKLKQLKTKKQLNIKKKEAPLLSVFYTENYLPYKKENLAPKSIRNIEIWFNFIIKSKMDKILNRYTAAEIEKFLYSIPQTRKRQIVRGLFNNIFTYAKRLGTIKNNPCDNVEQMKHEKVNGRAMSFKTQSAFFVTLFSPECTATKIEKLYLTFVYLTGTRRQEGLNITVDDIDWENNVLHIPGTKTSKSDRSIPLTPLTRRLLEKIVPESGNVFPISYDQAGKAMKKAISDYHLHELRHTFGTIAICVQKMDAKTVSIYMGHSTIEMTLKTYTHPEQLDKSLFYNGSLSEEEKLAKLKDQYQQILNIISEFL